MKIRVLRNLGRGLPEYREGQVVNADERTAEDLCRRGLAEVVGGQVRGTPPQPTRAVSDTSQASVRQTAQSPPAGKPAAATPTAHKPAKPGN